MTDEQILEILTTTEGRKWESTSNDDCYMYFTKLLGIPYVIMCINNEEISSPYTIKGSHLLLTEKDIFFKIHYLNTIGTQPNVIYNIFLIDGKGVSVSYAIPFEIIIPDDPK